MGNERYEFGHHYVLLDTKITEHVNSNQNPHNVNKAQVGLGEVDNTSDQTIYDNVEEYTDKTFAAKITIDETEEKLGEYTISLVNADGATISEAVLNCDNEYAIDKVTLDLSNQQMVFHRYNEAACKDSPLVCDLSAILPSATSIKIGNTELTEEKLKALLDLLN